MKLDHITHIVLLGAFGKFEAFAKSARKLGFHVDVITAPDHRDIFKTSIPPLVVNSINDPQVTELLDRTSTADQRLAISFGARWIIKQETRQALFGGQMLNAHGSRLPLDKGGAGFCWRIMRGDRLGNLVLHLVDDGLDTGPLIANEEYVLPPHCRKPEDFIADYGARLPAFMERFFKRVKSGHEFIETHQPEYFGGYFPRIHSMTHGWIDWSMSGPDLERFILAFDRPYPGAMTMLGDQVVHLKSCQITAGDSIWHPFQAGQIMRAGKFLAVCLASGHTLIVEDIAIKRNAKDVNIMDRVVVGDRFFTPSAKLDAALKTRVTYGAEGRR